MPVRDDEDRESRKKFGPIWGELDYLCRQVHHRMFVRRDKEFALSLLGRLERILSELPEGDLAIMRQEGLVSVSLPPTTLKMRQALMRRLRSGLFKSSTSAGSAAGPSRCNAGSATMSSSFRRSAIGPAARASPSSPQLEQVQSIAMGWSWKAAVPSHLLPHERAPKARSRSTTESTRLIAAADHPGQDGRISPASTTPVNAPTPLCDARRSPHARCSHATPARRSHCSTCM